MSVYSKDLRPSALKWVFGHVFFRGEDFYFAAVFFCEGTNTNKTRISRNKFEGSLFWT